MFRFRFIASFFLILLTSAGASAGNVADGMSGTMQAQIASAQGDATTAVSSSNVVDTICDSSCVGSSTPPPLGVIEGECPSGQAFSGGRCVDIDNYLVDLYAVSYEYVVLPY